MTNNQLTNLLHLAIGALWEWKDETTTSHIVERLTTKQPTNQELTDLLILAVGALREWGDETTCGYIESQLASNQTEGECSCCKGTYTPKLDKLLAEYCYEATEFTQQHHPTAVMDSIDIKWSCPSSGSAYHWIIDTQKLKTDWNALVIEKLRHVKGEISVHNGFVHLPDGSCLNLNSYLD